MLINFLFVAVHDKASNTYCSQGPVKNILVLHISQVAVCFTSFKSTWGNYRWNDFNLYDILSEEIKFSLKLLMSVFFILTYFSVILKWYVYFPLD